MTYSNPVQTGTINGGATPILADAGPGIDLANWEQVTLSTDYARSPPPGWPIASPPGQSGSATAAMVGTIVSGTVIVVPVPEAVALVAASATSAHLLQPAGQAAGAS